MTEDQQSILRDIQGFIQFALENDLDFMQVLATIGHDTSGLLRRKLNGELMHPRTAGYAKNLHTPTTEEEH